MASSLIVGPGREADDRLDGLDRPRVERAHVHERVAQQLAHHAEPVLGDLDAGRLDAPAQLLQAELRLAVHQSLLRARGSCRVRRPTRPGSSRWRRGWSRTRPRGAAAGAPPPAWGMRASAADDPAGLELEAGQAAGVHRGDLEPDAETAAEGGLHAAGADVAVLDLEEHARLVQLTVEEDLDLELLHREAAHDGLDGRGMDVHPAHDQHVVEPAENAPLEAGERAPPPAPRCRAAGP